ncbi:cytochrome c oxidase accessory protein CcoG [Alienimonas sp. DA493]|uniref:cytochrome c oxidase accessory protein CcoG n=1 Tax=Alienimonas sp. DA493 TaxID=3373605 RepID=UPI0037544780
MAANSRPTLSVIAAPAAGGRYGGSGGCADCKGAKGAAPRPSLAAGLEHTAAPCGGPLLEAPDRVLPTLERDGTRRWVSPRLAKGSWWRLRRAVAYVLMAVFVVTPHLRWGGEPLVLLDVARRRFLLFGHEFLPTDTPLLALLAVATVLSVMFVTAVFGRAWCGWACPQTVFLEFLFRPLDRLFGGTAGRGGPNKKNLPAWRGVARVAVSVIFSLIIAHSFLAFFVGTEALARWVRQSPLEHPTAFLVMAGVTVAFLANFLWFREQFCTVACPYGRFQSVMLDRQSLVVAYDVDRGEPRGKGKRRPGTPTENLGDCIECGWCVAVCPTGIDIRDGLQMECVNCTQCVDACDETMRRIGRPPGLIRYASQETVEGGRYRFWRARTVVYPLLVVVVGFLFVLALDRATGLNASLFRGPGQPFTVVAGEEAAANEEAVVRNSVRLRLANRTGEPRTYTITPIAPPGVTAELLDGPPTLDPGETDVVPVLFAFPRAIAGPTGRAAATFTVADDAGNARELEFRLIGPAGPVDPRPTAPADAPETTR